MIAGEGKGRGRVPGLGAAVLCGGKSSRMGRPKAWLPFLGETLLQRTVNTLRMVADPVVVVAAVDQALPDLPPGVVITRDPAEGRGPLLGIAAAIEALAGAAESAFISSTDAPFLSEAIVRRLAELRAGHDIVVPRATGHYHPLCALYSTRVLPEAKALLDAGRLRPFFLFERARTLVADEALLLAEGSELAAVDPTLRSLRNINTPEEYEAALREAATREAAT